MSVWRKRRCHCGFRIGDLDGSQEIARKFSIILSLTGGHDFGGEGGRVATFLGVEEVGGEASKRRR